MSRREEPPIRVMNLRNMRENGARAVIVSCTHCDRRQVSANVDALPGHILVPEVWRRLRCSRCGERPTASRPDWPTR